MVNYTKTPRGWRLSFLPILSTGCFLLFFILFGTSVNADNSIQPGRTSVTNQITCEGSKLRILADLFGVCKSLKANREKFKEAEWLGEGYTYDKNDPKISMLSALSVSPFLTDKTGGTIDQIGPCIQKYWPLKKPIDPTKIGYSELDNACEALVAENKDIEDIAFWFPEYFLLLNETKDVASEYAFKDWQNILYKDNGSQIDQITDPGGSLLLPEQPLMGQAGWERLKKSMRERWDTEYGEKIREQVVAWLYQHHTMEQFPGPKPSIGGMADLRGIRLEGNEAKPDSNTFTMVGCNLKNVDLWSAIFKKITIYKGEFSGAKVADVLFDNVNLAESSFIGEDEKYGPHFTTFNEVGLEKSYWKKVKINGVVFNKSRLKGSRFIDCDFTNTLFLSSQLDGVVFENCVFGENVRFYNCNLTSIQLKNTWISQEQFTAPPNVLSALLEVNKPYYDEEVVSQLLTSFLVDFYDGPDSYIGRASPERMKDTVDYITDSLTKALIVPSSNSYWYGLLGVERKMPLLYFSKEEKTAGLVGFKDKNASLQFYNLGEQIKNNLFGSGKKEAFREWYVRTQMFRNGDIFRKGWVVVEGLSSGFGTRPVRFFFFFGAVLSVGALVFGNHGYGKLWNKECLSVLLVLNVLVYLGMSNVLFGIKSNVAMFALITLLVILVCWGSFRSKCKDLGRSYFNLFASVIPGINASIELGSSGDLQGCIGKSNEEETVNGGWLVFTGLLQIFLIYQSTRILKMWWL